MTDTTTILEKINARNAEIEAEIAALSAEMAKNDAAREVILGFAALPPFGPTGPAPAVSPKVTKGAPRPENIPSTREMVQIALKERERPSDGMTGPELVQFIRRKWWPGLHRMQILPQVYSLTKQQSAPIRNVGGRFYLRKTP